MDLAASPAAFPIPATSREASARPSSQIAQATSVTDPTSGSILGKDLRASVCLFSSSGRSFLRSALMRSSSARRGSAGTVSKVSASALLAGSGWAAGGGALEHPVMPGLRSSSREGIGSAKLFSFTLVMGILWGLRVIALAFSASSGL